MGSTEAEIEETRIGGAIGTDDKMVRIVLDKPRYLSMTLNALCDFEKATGKNATELSNDMSATDMRALLWACLRHEDELLLPGDVGKMIHPGNMAMVGKALSDMMNNSMPENRKTRRAKKKTSPLAVEE